MKKSYNIFKKLGRKNLALSIVALVLISVMLVGATYSWIENITAVQITNIPQDGTGSNTATLEFANDINETIELGNCGADSDDATKSKYSAVNLGTYFNESGGMHLTTCSGNGESFYFKTLKGSENAKTYRIGTEDDENVNYISATFMVCSPEADVDMWFDEIPTVKCEGADTDSIARYSITVDGETNVYSESGETYQHINDADGKTTETVAVRKTSAYTFDNSDNVKDGKENGNVLFRVGEEPKEVTIRIWLQYTGDSDAYTALKPDINMVLASTWAKTRRITVFDGTSENKKEHWLSETDSPKLFVALASDPNKFHWELTIDKDTYEGTVDIPSYYYTGNEIYVFRVPSDYKWGDSAFDGAISVTVGTQTIYCWNYWKTELPKGFDDLKFNIVGNTPNITTNNIIKQTDTGYSFWGEADHITVTNTAGLTNYQDDTNRMLVKDVNTGNIYPLCSDGTNWTGYIPHTSDKITFLYRSGGFTKNDINSKNSTSNTDNCYINESAEHSWGYVNGQTRPYNDVTYNIYTENDGTWTDWIKTDYVLAGYFNNDTTNWNDSNYFYKENESDVTAFAYIKLQTDILNQIKVVDVSGSSKKYYSNEGVMCRSNSKNWEMTTKVESNMGLISDGYDGTYRFELNTSTLELSVTYPGSGGQSRVYLVTNYGAWDKYAYMWKTKDGNTTTNANWPGEKMKYLGNLNSRDIYYLAYPDGLMPEFVIFSGSDDNGNTTKWQTGDLEFKESYSIYYHISS